METLLHEKEKAFLTVEIKEKVTLSSSFEANAPVRNKAQNVVLGCKSKKKCVNKKDIPQEISKVLQYTEKQSAHVQITLQIVAN